MKTPDISSIETHPVVETIDSYFTSKGYDLKKIKSVKPCDVIYAFKTSDNLFASVNYYQNDDGAFYILAEIIIADAVEESREAALMGALLEYGGEIPFPYRIARRSHLYVVQLFFPIQQLGTKDLLERLKILSEIATEVKSMIFGMPGYREFKSPLPSSMAYIQYSDSGVMVRKEDAPTGELH